MRTWSVVVLALLLATAFTMTAPDRVIGVIGSGDFDEMDPRPLAAPDTVQAGSTFDVEVTTIGPNMCWSAADAKVTYDGHKVTIVPYDYVEEGACAQAIVRPSRTVELQFDTPGEATIRVQGRATRHDEDITSEVSTTVVVE